MVLDYYVDHTSRFPHNTGIQRCVRAIARALLANGVSLHPVVWDRQRQDLSPATSEGLEHLARWSGPPFSAWSAGSVSPADDWLLVVELVRGSNNPSSVDLHRAAKRRGLRVAWVFHDAIPLRMADLYGPVAQSHVTYMQGLAEADLVFANSRTSAEQLRVFLQQRGLRWQHVRALPLALEFSGVPRVLPQPGTAVLSRPQRLLAVASLERRKNHVALLKAVAWLIAHQQFHAELVLVGWPNDPAVVSLVRRAQACGLPVRWEDSADDARLSELYQWCDVTLVTSLEEGFGLPVAESLWHGKPCLTTSNGALGELVAGGGCWPFDSPAWSSLVDGIHSYLCNADLRDRLLVELDTRPLRLWADYVGELLAELS